MIMTDLESYRDTSLYSKIMSYGLIYKGKSYSILDTVKRNNINEVKLLLEDSSHVRYFGGELNIASYDYHYTEFLESLCIAMNYKCKDIEQLLVLFLKNTIGDCVLQYLLIKALRHHGYVEIIPSLLNTRRVWLTILANDDTCSYKCYESTYTNITRIMNSTEYTKDVKDEILFRKYSDLYHTYMDNGMMMNSKYELIEGEFILLRIKGMAKALYINTCKKNPTEILHKIILKIVLSMVSCIPYHFDNICEESKLYMSYEPMCEGILSRSLMNAAYSDIEGV
jgi:hypothetical protein